MNIKNICIALLLFSCSHDKNKPYDNVNITKEQKVKTYIQPEGPVFPMIVENQGIIILELDHSDLIIKGSKGDKINVDFENGDISKLDISTYTGNKQFIIKEKLIGKRPDFNSKWVMEVPEFMNLQITSENGKVEVMGISGTFNIKSPVGDVFLSDISAAMQISSQSGSIEANNWIQRGRSRLLSASNNVKIKCMDDLLYELSLHSGSDTVSLNLNGKEMKLNAELLTFKGEGNVFSELETGPIEDFYSDAIEKKYDMRKIQSGKNLPLASISTGNGVLIIHK